ncbi:fimbrial-associated protein [Serratia symbiotica str. 'Cinara cedri']|nr:fimbrial-associated protein [Serratia symbiotica str. 'Cinara cedri']
MSLLLRYRYFNLAIGLLITLGVFSQISYALSCKQNGNIRQDIILDKSIKVSSAHTKPGTLLWRSQDYTTILQCVDDWNIGYGEDAFLYWDPQSRLGQIHRSIEVGVHYNDLDIQLVNGRRQNTGSGTGAWGSPGIVTLYYYLYIKATGNPPPESGKIEDNNAYPVFQVDGMYGLNNIPSRNFNNYISGLNNIQFISCTPKITVVGNQGSSINFGTIAYQNALVGKVEKQAPFFIIVNLFDSDNGQNCRDQAIQASFSSTYPTQDNSVLLPTRDSGFGIFISQDTMPDVPITMQRSVDLGFFNGTSVKKNFIANLLWLNTNPKIGPFTTSVNIDVTLK